MISHYDDRIVCYCLSRRGKVYLTLSPVAGERIDRYIYPPGTKAEVLIRSREHGSRWEPVYIEKAHDWYEHGDNEFWHYEEGKKYKPKRKASRTDEAIEEPDAEAKRLARKYGISDYRNSKCHRNLDIIVEGLKSGKTYVEIADEISVEKSTIRKFAIKHGLDELIPSKPADICDARINEIQELLELRVPMKYIASTLGVSYNALYAYLRRNNLLE